MEQERRYFTLQDIEVRQEGDGPAITGYAAVFNAFSSDMGGFREKIAPGAFSRSLVEDDIRALFDHDSKYVLGRNVAGTLELREDKRGLQVSISPPDTQWARDLMTTMKRGDVNQMSFGFFKRADDWNMESDPPERTLRDVQLLDVSIVTYPAYPQTSAEARSQAALSEAGDATTEPVEDDRPEARRNYRKREIEIKRLKT